MPLTPPPADSTSAAESSPPQRPDLDQMVDHDAEPQLQRHLTNRHVQLIAIGGAIGTGLFMGSGKTISLAGPGVFLVYAVIGAILFLVMRALGEVLLSNLSYKSFADVAHDLIGPWAGFFVGWTYYVCWLVTAVAEVIVINASPDGLNINDNCGSTHPEQLQNYVKAVGADMGVAYDGDADRCLAVDADGKLVDGDQIMGMLAIGMKADGTLGSDTLVVTVMSNLGLILAMREHGIRTVQTGVGDRYVLERMLQGGYTLGGEQSGHIAGVGFDLYVRMVSEAVAACKKALARSGKAGADAIGFEGGDEEFVALGLVGVLAVADGEVAQAAAAYHACRRAV